MSTTPVEDVMLFWERPAAAAKVCHHCNGTGHLQQHYSLAPSVDPIPGAPADAIQAVPVGVAAIFECTDEALVLATTHQRPVVFDFNGQLVRIDPGSNAEQVAREWWRKAYGETWRR